ncbi:MAG: nucleotide exchange factor GrpE [Thermoleophilia bacterium]
MTHDPAHTGPDPLSEAPPEQGGAAPAPGDVPPAREAPAAEAGDGLAAVAEERDRYLDQLLRLKAEFDNYRKRTERDRQAQALGATRDVVKGLLPVMDNLERAVAALGDQGEGIVAGLEMVRGQLAGLLEGHGVREIEAAGREFDPSVHEAIAQVPAPGTPGGTVIEVVEKGYRHVDHVLRPTRVVVSAEPATAPGPDGPRTGGSPQDE